MVLVLLGRLFLLWRPRLLLLLLFLNFLLLALLHFLLLLVVFAFHLLELLLLALLLLLLALLVGVLFLEFPILLNLLLFELLALLILLLAQAVYLLLLAFLDLRIHVRSRSGRPVVVGVVIRTIVGLRLRRLIGRPIVVRLLLIVGLRLRRLVGRPIVVRLRLARPIRVGLTRNGLIRLIGARRGALALRRQLRLPRFLHHANIVAGLIVLANLRRRHGSAAIRLDLLQLTIHGRDRRRRRGLGHDGTGNGLRRRANARLCRGAEDAARLRSHSRRHRRNLRR